MSPGNHRPRSNGKNYGRFWIASRLWILCALCALTAACRPPDPARHGQGGPGSRPPPSGTPERESAGPSELMHTALRLLDRASNAATRVRDVSDRQYYAYLITLLRIRAGVLQRPEDLEADLSKWFPKVREDLRPYKLRDAYYRLLLARAAGHGWKKRLQRAMDAARYGAARVKNGIEQYIHLAKVLAEQGDHAAAEQVLCEAVTACSTQQPEETRNGDLATLVFEALALWGNGGSDRFLYLAVEAAMRLPVPQPYQDEPRGGFTTYREDGPPYTRFGSPIEIGSRDYSALPYTGTGRVRTSCGGRRPPCSRVSCR